MPREAGAALRQAAALDLTERASHLLGHVAEHLPGPEPDLYVGPLFGIAPAATIAVGGRPAIAIGADLFHPLANRQQFPRQAYHPDELEEMIPHEAAHVVRMESLSLPPTPRDLSLLDMVMLEGTALTFSDLLLGRRTLATFLDPHTLHLHEQRQPQILAAASQEWECAGMPAFLRWFGVGSFPSGYYVGEALCQAYWHRFGTVPLTVPSQAILASLE